MSTKTQKVTHYTSTGVARYPWLTTPDTKFDPEGTFKVDLVLDGENADALQAKIDTFLEQSWAEKTADMDAKKLKLAFRAEPYGPVTDDDTDEETGETRFSFKRNAVGKSKKTGKSWKNKVKLVDSRGKACWVKVGGGSQIKVAFQQRPYAMVVDAVDKNDKPIKRTKVGVTLDLIGVQILDLIEFGEGDCDFEAQEGGFEDDGTHTAPPADEPATEGGSDEGGDGEEKKGDGSIDF